MKKKSLIVICILLFVIIVGTIWYKMPIHFTNLHVDEVSEIVIFDGNSGKTLHITEKNEIEHIIENLNSIKMQRDGISLFRMGYSFKITIYLTNGEEANGWNNFIINSNNTIRKDPFTYKVIEGNTDYDYIQDLVRTMLE